MPTVASVAALVQGEVVGDSTLEINNVSDLVSAGPGDLSFLANPKYAAQLVQTKASAVLVAAATDAAPCTQVVCGNPYLAMARVAAELHPRPRRPAGVEAGAHVHPDADVHPTASVAPGAVVEAGARVGARSEIGAGCYVGPAAVLGEDVLMHPGSRVLHRCVLGDRVILQAGAVIGSDGFGYAPDAQGRRQKIPQVGIVELGDDVEVGANCTVDRATFGVTRLGAGTKLDNLVQIAHNVVLGRDCVIVSQSGIAGSTRLGDRVVVGAQGGIVGHITIASDVMLGARAGVAGSVSEPGIYSGTPLQPHKEWLKSAMSARHVPEMRRRLRQLENRVAELRANSPRHEGSDAEDGEAGPASEACGS